MLGMKIESAYWTPKINILLVRCQCGKLFEHPANRKVVICPQCGLQRDATVLKGVKNG